MLLAPRTCTVVSGAAGGIGADSIGSGTDSTGSGTDNDRDLKRFSGITVIG